MLAGIGEIVVGQEACNKDLVDSGVSKMKDFLKVKKLPWLRNFPNFGIAISNMIEENYDLILFTRKKFYVSLLNLLSPYLSITSLDA